MAHELAGAVISERGALESGAARLPFRDLIGDPFDLSRRSLLMAVATLTIRRDRSGQPTFLLHWRDPALVAGAGGIHQVVPTGIFQPASVGVASLLHDFDLWRNVVREFSEELLGRADHRTHQAMPIDYGSWRFFQELDRARAERRVRLACLGVGIDPLTLSCCMLTAAVFDHETYDCIFRDMITSNDEGALVVAAAGEASSIGLPFTGDVIEQAVSLGSLQPSGSALLRLAWRHRAILLDAQRG